MHLTESVFEFGCDVLPTHGGLDLADARIVSPGQPDQSVLLERMQTDDTNQRMAPGSLRVDTEGIERLRTWIKNLNDCPTSP